MIKPCAKSHSWTASGVTHKCDLFVCDKCGCWKFVNPKNGNCFYTFKEEVGR